jgi:hypothetical protein
MNDDRIRSALANGEPPRPDPTFVDRLEGRLVAELAEPGRTGRPRLQALVAVATAVVFLLAGGYLLRPQAGVDEPATPSILEPPTSPSSTLPTTASSAPTTTTVATTMPLGQISGALPDGTPFVINGADTPLVVEGISAAIVLDRPDGSSPVIGITQFNRIGQAVGGEWEVEFDLYDDIRAELGGSVDDLIAVSSVNGFPVLDLTPPLRFARDEEVPHFMQVMFEDFVVMRGCGPLAWRCSERGAVQVVPIDAVVAPAERPDLTEVWIQSDASRWRGDPSYLDPGPLSPRGDHFVAWTGSELLVYGGFPGDGDGTDGLTDGAAFNPATNQWRLMAAAPDGVGSSGAVWTGEEMVVVSGTETFAYDPELDRWRTVAGPAPIVGGRWDAVFDGTGVVAWLNSLPRTLARLDMEGGEWQELSAPPGRTDPWARTLRVIEGSVYAVTLDGDRCSGVSMHKLAESGWVEVPMPSLATETFAQCNLPQDSAVVDGRLLFWEARDHPAAVLDPATGEWTDIEGPPVGGCEGGSSSVVAGDRVYVESCGSFAVFDADTDSWSRVVLPGSLGFGFDAVWTGSELLMWGGPCCYGTGGPLSSIDAWRWSPP